MKELERWQRQKLTVPSSSPDFTHKEPGRELGCHFHRAQGVAVTRQAQTSTFYPHDAV